MKLYDYKDEKAIAAALVDTLNHLAWTLMSPRLDCSQSRTICSYFSLPQKKIAHPRLMSPSMRLSAHLEKRVVLPQTSSPLNQMELKLEHKMMMRRARGGLELKSIE